MKIGTKQKSLVHVAKMELGLDDNLYRDILESTCGVRSSKELNFDQFDKLMKRFRKLGFKMKHHQPYLNAPDRDPGGLPSPALLHKINELYNELGWVESERQIGFNRRVIKKPWPQTRQEAIKIIEGLKSMVARKSKTV